jgi:hypothetical protein
VKSHQDYTEAEIGEAFSKLVEYGILEVTRTDASGETWYRLTLPVEEIEEVLRQVDDDRDLAD